MIAIRTPDQRLRIFVSSTMKELAGARAAARTAIERLRLIPVLFELGARPYPPRDLYLAYLRQSDVFIGIYGQQYGWIAPDQEISGLEDEYLNAGGMPKLVYVQSPAPDRDPRLSEMLSRIQSDGLSYRGFGTSDELGTLIADDLAVLLSERFDLGGEPPETRAPREPPAAGPGVPVHRTGTRKVDCPGPADRWRCAPGHPRGRRRNRQDTVGDRGRLWPGRHVRWCGDGRARRGVLCGSGRVVDRLVSGCSRVTGPVTTGPGDQLPPPPEDAADHRQLRACGGRRRSAWAAHHGDGPGDAARHQSGAAASLR